MIKGVDMHDHEEYFTLIDIYCNLKQTLKHVLERTRWL